MGIGKYHYCVNPCCFKLAMKCDSLCNILELLKIQLLNGTFSICSVTGGLQNNLQPFALLVIPFKHARRKENIINPHFMDDGIEVLRSFET